MAITRDYLEPTETQDASETKFIDQLLEGWAKWARNSGVDQRPTAAGDLWQIETMFEIGTYVLELVDDNFVLVDQKIALLPRRLNQVVFIEYMGAGPSKAKAQQIGLAYLAYRQRLHAAQWSLHTLLSEFIDQLRLNATVSDVKKALRYRGKGHGQR
ncbi:MAG TPA: hypothetical protein VGL45_09705 [Bradyrhizobium sp.]